MDSAEKLKSLIQPKSQSGKLIRGIIIDVSKTMEDIDKKQNNFNLISGMPCSKINVKHANNFQKMSENIIKSHTTSKKCIKGATLSEMDTLPIERCDFILTDNNKYVCSLCNWISLKTNDHYMEELLAHCQSTQHKLKLKERFEAGDSNATKDQGQKLKKKNKKKKKDLPCLSVDEKHLNVDQLKAVNSEPNLNNLNKTQITSPKYHSKKRRNKSAVANNSKNSNESVRESKNALLHSEDLKQSVEKLNEKTVISRTKTNKSEHNSEAISQKNQKILSEIEHSINSFFSLTSNDDPDNDPKVGPEREKSKKNKELLPDKNCLYIQGKKEKDSYERKKMFGSQPNIFENLPSISNSQSLAKKKVTFKMNEQNGKKLNQVFWETPKQDIKNTSKSFAENQTSSTSNYSAGFSDEQRKKSVQIIVAEVMKQCTSGNQQSSCTDQNFISFTSDNKVTCSICQMSMPQAKNFGCLMNNIQIHINGAKHIKNKQMLREMLSKTVDALH